MIVFNCPTCGKPVRAPENLAGKAARCPSCKNAATVPNPSEAVRPEPPVAAVYPARQSPPPPSEFLAIDDSDERDYEERRPRRRSWRRDRDDREPGQRANSTDAAGVISLIFGSISLLLTFLGCCTCGVTWYVATPMAFIGGVLGIFARGNLRVGGITLNTLAFLPAMTMIVLTIVGVTLPVIGGSKRIGGWGTGSSQSTSSAPVTQTVNLGEEIRFGDLGVTVVSAKLDSYTSSTAAGRKMTHDPALVATITFKNYNPKTIIDAGSQADHAELNDDVGNKYSGIRAINEIGLTNQIDGQIPPGRVRRIRSDESSGDVLVFDRPVAGAAVLLLTLDAKRYGESGQVIVRIPRSAWGK
jgi:hypothetical protein